MTGKELLEKLQSMTKEELDLPVEKEYWIDGTDISSGFDYQENTNSVRIQKSAWQDGSSRKNPAKAIVIN